MCFSFFFSASQALSSGDRREFEAQDDDVRDCDGYAEGGDCGEWEGVELNDGREAEGYYVIWIMNASKKDRGFCRNFSKPASPLCVETRVNWKVFHPSGLDVQSDAESDLSPTED